MNQLITPLVKTPSKSQIDYLNSMAESTKLMIAVADKLTHKTTITNK